MRLRSTGVAFAVLALLAGGCLDSSGGPLAQPSSASETGSASSSPSAPASAPPDHHPPVSVDAFTWTLNQHLKELLERAGFEPAGGDHDWDNASQIVGTDGGAHVSVFLYPMERADLGDVTFEPEATETVGDNELVLGQRSNGQAAARFDCGDFQFQAFAADEAAVHAVARGLAAVASCPYEADTSESLGDGRHAVYVHGVDVERRTITADAIKWLSGEEARAAYQADDPGSDEGPPNDYDIVNDYPWLRTMRVADDVIVELVRLREDGDPDLDPGSWAELPGYLADDDARDGHRSWRPFWITITRQVVVAIEEQYTP